MIAAGIDESKVCLRQGHDVLTSMKHYQGLALDDELTDIIKQLEEWNIIQRQTLRKIGNNDESKKLFLLNSYFA